MPTEMLDEFISEWEQNLDSLVEDVNEEIEVSEEFSESDAVDREAYSVRKLNNGDYVISTPANTYLVDDGSISDHEKGRVRGEYGPLHSKLDEKIETLLEHQFQ